jgi:hypothetical protein
MFTVWGPLLASDVRFHNITIIGGEASSCFTTDENASVDGRFGQPIG